MWSKVQKAHLRVVLIVGLDMAPIMQVCGIFFKFIYSWSQRKHLSSPQQDTYFEGSFMFVAHTVQDKMYATV